MIHLTPLIHLRSPGVGQEAAGASTAGPSPVPIAGSEGAIGPGAHRDRARSPGGFPQGHRRAGRPGSPGGDATGPNSSSISLKSGRRTSSPPPHRRVGITSAIRTGHTRPALTTDQSRPSWHSYCDWLKTTAPARLDPGERDHDTIVGRPRAADVTARPIDGTGTNGPGCPRGPAPSSGSEPGEASYRGLRALQ